MIKTGMVTSGATGTARRVGCILLAFILTAFCSLATACDANNGDGADGNGTTAAVSGDTESDSGGNGENSSDGNGNSDTGDGADGDTDSGGSGDDDDSFATTTAAVFSAEAQEQVRQFQAAAEQLPLDDIPSAAALLASYRELAADGPVNDALFFAYEENMQSVCAGINDVYQTEPPDEVTVNSALENGFLYVAEENPPYFILRPDFLHDTFRDSVGENVGAFLSLQAKHYRFHENYDFIENATLMVTLDELAEMIVDWENYVLNHQDAVNLDGIMPNLDYYLKIYIGSIQVENSGFYAVAGEDQNGETLYSLLDEPRQSYLRFIENYQDSMACPLITDLYRIYEANNFLYSVAIEDFFRDNNLAYDV